MYLLKAIGGSISAVNVDTLPGSIWATCSSRIRIHANAIDGGSDVGVDFEHCIYGTAIGNTIHDVKNGALSAIFGCSDIDFQSNIIVFDRILVGSVSTSGATWTNTSNMGLLLRDSPMRIKIEGNTFACTNGALMQANAASQSTEISIVRNRFVNAYLISYGSVSGAASDLLVEENGFSFLINVNNPVIQVQTANRLNIRRNRVVLLNGENGPKGHGSGIDFYDPSGSSRNVDVRENVVVDPSGTAHPQITIDTNDSALVGSMVDNVVSGWIGLYWLNGSVHKKFIVGGNCDFSNVELLPFAQDNNAVPVGTLRTAWKKGNRNGRHSSKRIEL